MGEKTVNVDPEKPLHPPKPYFLWLDKHRAIIANIHPNADESQLDKIASAEWRALSDKSLSKWRKMYQNSLVDYWRRKAEYYRDYYQNANLTTPAQEKDAKSTPEPEEP